MTQDQVSDLRSLTDRAIQTAVDRRNATLADTEAKRQLDNFISTLAVKK